jgi:ribokinase
VPVVVVGSLNMDLVVRSARLPRPGETLSGHAFRTQPGGKGANQAVAAARAGATVTLHGTVGADAFGGQLHAFVAAEGVDASGVVTAAGPSGVALVGVADDGENAIVVVSGANAATTGACHPGGGDVLLLQQEVPAAANRAAAALARAAGARVVLNLAPFRSPDARLLDLVDVLVVNQTELAQLVGAAPDAYADPKAIAAVWDRVPGRDVVVTVGAHGAYARVGGEVVHQPGRRVRVVDSTGAGDCFCGALGAALAEGRDLRAALAFAGAAAALAVTREGAAGAMPLRAEIDALLGPAS